MSLPNGSSQDVVTGPWTLRFSCSGGTNNRLFTLGIPAGTGGVQLSGTKAIDDQAANTIAYATGAGLPSGPFAAVGVNSPNGAATFPHFYRLNGSFILHDGLGATSVTYDMFLDDRNNQGTCAFRGTAVHSGLIR